MFLIQTSSEIEESVVLVLHTLKPGTKIFLDFSFIQLVVLYFGSDISYSYMLLNENSKIRDWCCWHQDFQWHQFEFACDNCNPQYIKVNVKAIPVLWSHHWHSMNIIMRKKHVTCGLFGLHNTNLGSSLWSPWVILFSYSGRYVYRH